MKVRFWIICLLALVACSFNSEAFARTIVDKTCEIGIPEASDWLGLFTYELREEALSVLIGKGYIPYSAQKGAGLFLNWSWECSNLGKWNQACKAKGRIERDHRGILAVSAVSGRDASFSNMIGKFPNCEIRN